MAGCGGDGGAGQNDNAVKGASLAVIPSSNSEYVIQGNNLDGVAALKLTVNYDTSILSSPAVTNGNLINSNALMVSNTKIPGSIIIAMVTTTAISGSGQVATFSFGSATGQSSVSIVSAQILDSNSKELPLTY
jgi:hypothetical protein